MEPHDLTLHRVAPFGAYYYVCLEARVAGHRGRLLLSADSLPSDSHRRHFQFFRADGDGGPGGGKAIPIDAGGLELAFVSGSGNGNGLAPAIPGIGFDPAEVITTWMVFSLRVRTKLLPSSKRVSTSERDPW